VSGGGGGGSTGGGGTTGGGGGGGGLSSFPIVPIACPSAIVALLGSERVTKKFSSASIALSPCTGTATDFEVSPAANVSVPFAAAKSSCCVAVPPAVA
jgi:hypothetical protein